MTVLSVTQNHPGDVDVVMQFDRQPYPLARQLQLRLASGATVVANRVDELASSEALMICFYSGPSVAKSTLQLLKSELSSNLVPAPGYSRLGAQVFVGEAFGGRVIAQTNGFVDDSVSVAAALSRIEWHPGGGADRCALSALATSLKVDFASRRLLMLVSWKTPVDSVFREQLLAAIKSTPNLTVTVVNVSAEPPSGRDDNLTALYAFGGTTPSSIYLSPTSAEGIRAIVREQVDRATPGPAIRAHFTYTAVDDPSKATTATVKFQDAPDSGLVATVPVPLLPSK